MNRVYVAIGSNLGDSASNIQSSLDCIRSLPSAKALTVSPWYRTKAIGGPADQPDYINAACTFLTSLDPAQLLSALQDIEKNHGRTRKVHWGPRTLDLDIIWYENFTSQQPALTVPHPRAHQRAFVLQPLIDLKAEFLLEGNTLQHWHRKTSHQIIQPISIT